MFMADKAPEWIDGECCHRCRVGFSTFQRKVRNSDKHKNTNISDQVNSIKFRLCHGCTICMCVLAFDIDHAS